MAEWVIFDAAFSDVTGIPSAIFFGFSALCNSLARDVGFKCRLDLERPLLGIEHEEKEMQSFFFHFCGRSTSMD